MLIVFSFLFYLPVILAGFRAAHAIWPETSPQALWFKLFLGIPVGMGLWSLVYFLWLWAGLSQLFFPWMVLIISLVITAFSWPVLKLLFKSVNLRQMLSPLNLALLLVVAVMAGLFALRVEMNPHGYEDAWYIWNLDSRFIYFAQNFRVLYTPAGPGWHPDYPLMVSLNVVYGWVLLGQNSTRVPIAVASFFTLALPALLYTGLEILKDKQQAALATIVLLATPLIIFYGASQQADIPVALFMLASIILLALYFKIKETRLLFLAGLTTSLSAWAKNEGILFIVVSLALMIVFFIFSHQIRNLKNYVAGLAIPLLVILYYKFSIPVGNDLFKKNDLFQFLDWNRYTVIFQNGAEYIAGFGQWPWIGLAGVLIIYALLVGFDYPQGQVVVLIGLALLLQLAGYFVIYILTPHELNWHLNTSLERLLLQLFPAGLFLFFYATKSPDFNLMEGWKNAARD